LDLASELVIGKGKKTKYYKRDNEEPLLTEPHKIGSEPINFTDHASSGGRPTGLSNGLIQPMGSIDSRTGRPKRHSGYAFNEENQAHSQRAEEVRRASFKKLDRQ
jgi:hypothetical protein